MISQLTVFLENEKGRLAAACRTVSDAGINMHALNLADTADFGVARLLVDTPDAAAKALQAAGYRATVTPVLAVRVPNVPGGLATLLEFLDEQDVNIEYGYCFSVNEEIAIDVLKIAGDSSIEQKLTEAGFKPVQPEEIYHLGSVRLQNQPRLRRVFALAVALCLSIALMPASAFADVRKADVVLGQTVDARGLSIAQCPSIDAEYAQVMGADGTVYFERNATNPTQIASITKIMTAVVVLDAVANGSMTLDTNVEVSAAAAQVGESSAGLQEGDTMTLEAALKALLVPSGNDAAVALAEKVAGSEEAFVGMMNDKAAELGCVDSLFANPHGLEDDGFEGAHHSCAADVAKIVQYAMLNDTFRTSVGGGDTTIPVTRADGTKADILLESTDGFLDIYEYAIGVKTGYTDLAGYSFAGAANKEGDELYAIVIHSTSEAQRFEDAKTLCEWVYEHKMMYQLANSPDTTTATIDGQSVQVPVVAEVAHSGWIDKTVKATLSDPTAAVEIFDLNGNVSQSLEFDTLSSTVHVGDKVGTITFKQRNAVIATQDLIACEEVAAPDFFEGVGIWWDRLFRGFSGQPQTAQSITLNETPLVVDKTAAA